MLWVSWDGGFLMSGPCLDYYNCECCSAILIDREKLNDIHVRVLQLWQVMSMVYPRLVKDITQPPSPHAGKAPEPSRNATFEAEVVK